LADHGTISTNDDGQIDVDWKYGIRCAVLVLNRQGPIGQVSFKILKDRGHIMATPISKHKNAWLVR
jgi:hypothetical protein